MEAILSPAPKVWQHQADAALSQANPVSTTLYTVLAATTNVRIIMVAINITWAVTQPTPIEVVVTIDGQTLTFGQANPVSTQNYRPYTGHRLESGGFMVVMDLDHEAQAPAFFLEGRSVKVEARVTWAITQPTPLVCRVKWARL